MTKSKTVWLLISILIIAGFLRLYKITTVPPGLYPDEAMNGNNALETLRTGDFKVFYPENNGREGLFINIQAVFLKIFGVNEPWVLRLPSAIFGILTVLGIYFLTKELFGKNSKPQAPNNKQIPNLNNQNSKPFGNWKLEIGNCEVALLASFLLATSFWHINFSRIGFRAIMAPLLLVWSLYFLLLAFRKLRSRTKFLFSIFSRPISEEQRSEGRLVWIPFLSTMEKMSFVSSEIKRDLANSSHSPCGSWRVAGYFLTIHALLQFYHVKL